MVNITACNQFFNFTYNYNKQIYMFLNKFLNFIITKRGMTDYEKEKEILFI